MKTFIVVFQRLGNHKGIERMFEAKTVPALEGPIQDYVERVLPNQNIEVTIEPSLMTGKLDYGLKGEFTIVSMD